jgi:hypothetical protein
MGWQPGPGRAASARDPRLALFASHDGRDALVPSGQLALIADEVSGSARRCPSATDDELTGLLRAFAAIESWAAEAKLGVIAEMVRRDDAPRNSGYHGDLPDEWSPSLRHELALALACSTQSAETTAWLAWELHARLPGVRALLGDGALTLPKARAVIETFKYLTDADAASAEALILGQLAGKTYPQVLRLAEQAALTVDPELAERRRLETQRRNARVTFFRELSGTAGLSGRDLPPDEALAAMAGVNARAQTYEDSGAFGDLRVDALRAYAYLDLLKGAPSEERIASAQSQDEAAEAAEALAWANARAARNAAQGQARHQAGTEPTNTAPPQPSAGYNGFGRDGGDDEVDDSGGGDSPGPDAPSSGGPASPTSGRTLQPRLPDLIVPLATLLGLAERPGEIQGFGLLDPALARDLAAAAAASPRTEVCVTVTSSEGYAIGHGCARLDRSSRSSRAAAAPDAASAALPARLNLTIPASALGTGSPRGTGPPDGFGPWTLVLPDGRRLTVRLDVIPVFGCDHRYETHAYQPGARLRHLVQVRDGTCTFPPCNRHARESDFEHAVPYHQGGRTDACNAGARSRACHRVKQTKGWNVSQPRPGWHQWTTPSGRIYTQEPKRYPA